MIMATYVDDVVLKTLCANLYSKATSADLAPHQVAQVLEANLQAYSQINQFLNDRGFTDAQISTWRDVAQCNKELGAYCFILLANIGKRLARSQLDHLGRWVKVPENSPVKQPMLVTISLYDSGGNRIEPENKKDAKYYGEISFDPPSSSSCGYVMSPDKEW